MASPDTLTCLLQRLGTIENRMKVLPCGLAVPKTATLRLTTRNKFAALRCEPMPEENPGVRGRAPIRAVPSENALDGDPFNDVSSHPLHATVI